jgi:kinesin family member C1
MEGPDRPTEQTRGMIPRAVHQIFECAAVLREQGWVYEFAASFLEIYNESIRDLLGKNDAKEPRTYEIKHNRDGSTSVTNLVVRML